MIYVLTSYDYDNKLLNGIFEGPDHPILDKIRDEFHTNFDYRSLGRLEYPKYKGPMIPYKATKFGGTCSGSIGEPADGTPYPDESSDSYKQWAKVCEKVKKDWNKRYNEKMKEMKLLYPGRDEDEMFISYLKKEYGFKEVPHQEFSP